MTDIKELTRTLRQAAEEELMCREASDTSDLWQDEAGPENVLALIEALEKAQKLATQQGNIACALFDEVTAQRQRIAEMEEENNRQVLEVMRLSSLVAEPESHTATVRRPRPGFIAVGSGRSGVYLKDEIDASLLAAGIKVKGE
ncbi:TPA: hypothetical protein N2F43_003983 [Salmonella enterica]|nr:hypothetical protein [Salmonella enterica]